MPLRKPTVAGNSRKPIIRNMELLLLLFRKAVRDLIAVSKAVAETEVKLKKDPESMSKKELKNLISQLEKQMRQAAADLNFEQAAEPARQNDRIEEKSCRCGKVILRFPHAFCQSDLALFISFKRALHDLIKACLKSEKPNFQAHHPCIS